VASNFSEEVFKQYLSPLSVALGMNMSSAWAQTAEVKKFPHIGISLNMMNTLIPDNKRSFTDPNGVHRPTVFGEETNGEIEAFGIEGFSFPVVQFHIGFFSNLEMIIRYTSWDVKFLGRTDLQGVGIKYELVEVPLFAGDPVFVSLLANYQNLEMEKFIKSASFGMTFNISKKLPIFPVTFIGSVRYSKNILTFESTEIDQNSTIGAVNVDGIDGLVYRAGLGYQLLFLRLYLDYNVGLFNTASGGISLEF